MKIKYRIKKSVTLIELVVAMTIVGILSVGLSAYINQTIDVWNFLSSRSDVVNYGRLSLTRMVNDIRWIANNTSIVSANNTSFVFNATDGSVVNYTYYNKRLIYNSNTLSSGVTNFGFTYFNNLSAAMPSPVSQANLTGIYRIGINATFGEGNQTSMVTTEVHPMNF